MNPVIWFVNPEEIPRNSKTFQEFLPIDFFAREYSVDTIASRYLPANAKPQPSDHSYTIYSRFGVFDRPVKIFSPYGKFEHVGDVLASARKRNDSIIVLGADGANCVYDAVLAARLLFSPNVYVIPSAIHFDLEMPGDREKLLKNAKALTFRDAVSLAKGEYNA